jgi:hypothetical protein
VDMTWGSRDVWGDDTSLSLLIQANAQINGIILRKAKALLGKFEVLNCI